MRRNNLIYPDQIPTVASLGKYRADCSKCKGICCVVLPFDADQGFGFDKAACEACSHLESDFRCRIHASLDSSGFPGCSRYECFGAGQRITQALALSDNWFKDTETLALVYKWFRASRDLHEKMALLEYCLDELQQQSTSGKNGGQSPINL